LTQLVTGEGGFFNYSNTHINTQNTKIVVEYSGGDVHNYVGVVGRTITGGTSYDGTATYMALWNGSSWVDAQGLTTGGGNVDISGYLWTSTVPPPGTQPPGTGAFAGPVYNVQGNSAFAPLQGLFNTEMFVAEVINDTRSRLIGTTISEIDINMAKTGSPVGPISAVVFNGSGALLASSPGPDASNLTTSFKNYRFLMNMPSGYTLGVGDRVGIFFQQQGTPSTLSEVMVQLNSTDPFDGNHSVIATFTPTGQYPNYLSGGTYGVWMGFGGKWVVNTNVDLAGTFYP
jgi:hypothetical protein